MLCIMSFFGAAASTPADAPGPSADGAAAVSESTAAAQDSRRASISVEYPDGSSSVGRADDSLVEPSAESKAPADSSPTPLLIDNEGMWFAVRNTGVSARTRWYEQWQHFVRDAYNLRILTVHFTETDNMVADMLTKALPKMVANFRKFRDFALNMGN